jgi:polyphosphate:AMP phosphotransferase
LFESAELGRKIPKEEYREAVPPLRTELLRVQSDLRLGAPFSVVIVIAGVDGAGKGETVNTLHEWMDPRFLETHAYRTPTAEEAARPPMWRFWRDLPPKGRIGIFFGSWYTQPILERVHGTTSDAAFEYALTSIEAFERELADEGVLLLKFWFHLSKKAQKRRLKHLSSDPETAWRVSDQDWEHFGLYDRFVAVCDEALRRTSTGEAPWTVVEGADRRYRELTVGRAIHAAVDARLGRPEPRVHEPEPPAREPRTPAQPTVLSRVDLSRRVERAEYADRLRAAQAKLGRLSRRGQEAGAPLVLVFEGWDAAGKGGAIRRVTAALDARAYQVVPVGPPTEEERVRPYLWRFWRQVPGAGRIAIFDRSWYGRVLVERVEGLATPDEWRRAYHEINDFEDQLWRHAYGLAKFWLHIDREEQGRRFAKRELTPYKKYKITAEDYRNRERWDLYEDAVNEMVERTSSAHAPWTLVAANDKRAARLQVLDACCACLEDAIERAGTKA